MKNQDRNAHIADAAQGTLERAVPCRNAGSVQGGRPREAKLRYGSGSPFKTIRRIHLRDGVPRRVSQASADKSIRPAGLTHRNGTKSPSMVGMNSETVG